MLGSNSRKHPLAAARSHNRLSSTGALAPAGDASSGNLGSSNGAFGSNSSSSSIPGWLAHTFAELSGSSKAKQSKRRVLVFLFLAVFAGCMLSSLSVMRPSNSSLGAHEQQSLKLEMADKQHSKVTSKTARTKAAAGTAAGPAAVDEHVASTLQQQRQQQEVGMEESSGTVGWQGQGGQPSQPLAAQDPAAAASSTSSTPDEVQGTTGRRRRRHTRHKATEKQQQQQQQQAIGATEWPEAVSGSSLTSSSSSDILHAQQGLPLPHTLQEKLLKQQHQLVAAAAAGGVGTAAAAAAAAIGGGGLQDLLVTGEQKPGSSEAAAGAGEVSRAPVAPAPAAAAADDDSNSVYITARGVAPNRLKYPVWWHGPIWAGSGYGSEAINYVLSLLRTGRLAPADLWAYHHGDSWREHVVKSLSEADRTELEYLQSLPVKYRDSRAAIAVCHSVPTNWAFPEPMWVAGAPCPPNPREFGWVYQVGRTMFETDRLPAMFVPRLNAMNEVWVPSEWQRKSFIASGVDAHKIVVVPEGVNTTLFDPAAYIPLQLADKAQLVFGRTWQDKQPSREMAKAQQSQGGGSSSSSSSEDSARKLLLEQQKQQQQQKQQVPPSKATGTTPKPAASGKSSNSSSSSNSDAERRPFVFISAFKWELRKGWDVLLQAYLSEFTSEDDVELYILTKPFSDSGSGFKEKMRSWADKLYGSKSAVSSASQTAAGKQQPPAPPPAAKPGRAAVKPRSVGAAGLKLVPTSADAAGGRLLLQQRQQQQGHLAAAGAADFPARVQWCGALGSTNCSTFMMLMPPDTAFDSSETLSSVQQQHGNLEQRTKDHAADVRHQIRLFAQQLTHSAGGILAASEAEILLPEQQLEQEQPPPQQQPQRRLSTVHKDEDAAATGTTSGSNSAAARSKRVASAAAAALQQLDAAAAASAAAAKYPHIAVVDTHISDEDFPRFYKAGDAFVLPTRGEGWGRPHVEAMSMALPVISTNWSGITAYLDESVGYPIAVEKLVPVQGGSEVIWWFKGLKWAQPSVKHLRQLMRRVYENRKEAAERGAAARALMVDKYSPEAIADLLVKEFKRIEGKIP